MARVGADICISFSRSRVGGGRSVRGLAQGLAFDEAILQNFYTWNTTCHAAYSRHRRSPNIPKADVENSALISRALQRAWPGPANPSHICQIWIQTESKKFLAKARRKITSKKAVLEPEKAPALYRSLDRERREFRLLHLLPSENFAAPIRCKISHSSLDKSPRYEALSYVWGNSNVTQDVLIHERPKEVTKNLELALRDIRLPKNKRILWVDALCIDQSHVIEKNHQVAQMRDIYLNSKRVVVWLGEERNAQSAIDFCRKLKQKNFSISGMSNDQFQKNLEACHDLFIERAWWNRRWILQEVLHDRRVQVYIGKIEIAFDELCQYFEAYDSSKTVWKIKNATKEVMLKSKKELGGYSPINVLFAADRKPVERISHQRSMIEKRDEPSTSLQITLQNFRSQQCTDPRDGVYALLGMAALKYSIPIDYNATKRTIFTLTMHALLPTSPNPFLWVESPDRPILSSISETDLPSWVPDWTTQQTLFVQTMTAYSYFSSFDASRSKTNYNGRIYIERRTTL